MRKERIKQIKWAAIGSPFFLSIDQVCTNNKSCLNDAFE